MLQVKTSNVGLKDCILASAERAKRYAAAPTVGAFINAHPKGKMTALRQMKADHDAGHVVFMAG